MNFLAHAFLRTWVRASLSKSIGRRGIVESYKCGFFSCVRLFVTPWIRAHQAPLSSDHLGKEASLEAQMVKNLPAMQETRVRSLGWEGPLEKERLPTPIFMPGEFHGHGSLVGYSPWGRKELGMTKQPTLSQACFIKLCQLLPNYFSKAIV